MNDQEAIRAMMTIVNTVLSPLVPVIIYPNTGTQPPTSGSTAWARVLIQHAQGRQRSIPAENQVHHQVGVLTLQIMEPTGRGIGSSSTFTPILRALRKANVGSLFFKNVTKNEIGTSGHWFQTNILAEFDYHTVDP